MDSRSERIILETERLRITGWLTLPSEGFRSRMSDFLNASEREFISLTDALIEPLDGSAPMRRSFVAVSREHVVLALPAQE